VVAAFKAPATLSAARRRRSLETGPVCLFVATKAHYWHRNLLSFILDFDTKIWMIFIPGSRDRLELFSP
jgi:hypothetical protein